MRCVRYEHGVLQRVTNCMSDLNEQMIINSTAPFLFCVVAKIAKQNEYRIN